ncbi:DNA-formamidopyrimidine glycosylase [Isobaculum melis]|nr:DNA-formamidopyrimidine glycosylase [Isobaculum melis]
MPELPEVETVRKGLVHLVKGSKIQAVDVYWDNIITPATEVMQFKEQLQGQTIQDVKRRGKYLIFLFDDLAMISHLRMEGKYEVEETNTPLKKHTHVVFHLTDGRDLRYLDVRKFGRMQLVPLATAMEAGGLKNLGPEPLPDTFLLKDFIAYLATRSRPVKPLLLEQKVVVGLGNIYVDEALFEAKIHPLRPADSLTKAEAKKLRLAIIDVLGRAVEAGGTTIRTYQNALGEAGKFQVALNVYGQTGAPCPRCGTPIEKIKVAQRGTHLCPHCQKLPMKYR